MRVDGLRKRSVSIGDNTTQVASAAKGRSASRAINKCCRRAAALKTAAGLQDFLLWCASAERPSDDASSRFGVRADKEKDVMETCSIT